MSYDDTQKISPHPRYQPTEALPQLSDPEEAPQSPRSRKQPRAPRTKGQRDFPWSDPTFVAVNQYHRLAPDQQTMLRSSSAMPSMTLWLLAVVIMTVLAGVAFYLVQYRYWELFLVPLVVLIWVGIRWLAAQARHSQILRAAERGLIEQAPGVVVKEGRTLTAQTNNRQLRTASAQWRLPPPGHYRFYYVSEGGILLSAQPLAEGVGNPIVPGRQVPGTATSSALLSALGNSLDFTPEDLDANRSGILSRQQRRTIAHHQTRAQLLCLLCILIALATLVISGIWDTLITVPAGFPHITDPNLQWEPLIVTGLALILALWAGLVARKYRADSSSGRVRRATGVVVRHMQTIGSGKRAQTKHTYEIDNVHFPVSAAAYAALQEGRSYCLYYAPHTRRLLSIEPLESSR